MDFACGMEKQGFPETPLITPCGQNLLLFVAIDLLN